MNIPHIVYRYAYIICESAYSVATVRKFEVTFDKCNVYRIWEFRSSGYSPICVVTDFRRCEGNFMESVLILIVTIQKNWRPESSTSMLLKPLTSCTELFFTVYNNSNFTCSNRSETLRIYASRRVGCLFCVENSMYLSRNSVVYVVTTLPARRLRRFPAGARVFVYSYSGSSEDKSAMSWRWPFTPM
jgi:hypothetical protein